MKNTKKIAVIMIVAILCLATALCCVACDNSTDDDVIEIKMWVSELDGVAEQFAAQVEAFNASQSEYKIKATVEGVGEGDAATQMITDVTTGADIYCFAQDQLTRLVQAGAIQSLGTAAKAAVIEANDAGSVAAATVGEKIYAFPLTSDNGYFMFYDTSVVDEAHIGDLDAIVADCKAADKFVAFQLVDNGWYAVSFFFGAGCVSEWTADDEGTFTSVLDDFNSDKGLIAAKGMSAFMNSGAFLNDSSADAFGNNAAVLISGTWNTDAVKSALRDNYGVAKLPKYTVDGKSYQLGSYNGCKLIGIKPTTDRTRAAALQALATYLTNEENQLARYNAFSWGPSNKNAQANEAVQADEALAALLAQNEYSIPQGNIHAKWWDVTKALGAAIQEAKGDATKLQAALDDYKTAINQLADPTYVPTEEPYWSVIGNMYGDTSWLIDHEMEELADGSYISIYPIYFQENAEFKIRYDKEWDDNVAYGDPTTSNGNIHVETAGLYWVKADVENKTWELVAADDFHLIGSFNSWSVDSDITLTNNGDGTFTASNVELDAKAEIKVRIARDGNNWEYDFGTDGDNYVVENAGTYTITVSFDKTNLTWVLALA